MVFTLNRLESLHGCGTSSGETSKFARNGVSKARIRRVLSDPGCNCRCSVPAALLYRICCAFWALSKGVQDSLLWSLQASAGRSTAKWKIEGCLVVPAATASFSRYLGHWVCRAAWLTFLGVGRARLSRTRKRHRGLDERSLRCGALARGEKPQAHSKDSMSDLH